MFLAQASASGTGAMASLLIPLVIFFVLMYFMITKADQSTRHIGEKAKPDLSDCPPQMQSALSW